MTAGDLRPVGSHPGPGFVRFAWAVLAVNLGVILWGAFVRASGSGAGCGSHWPLCNGSVLPVDPGRETIIEFVHRLGSGLAFLLVLGLWVWTLRRFARGTAARRWAWMALGLILLEAAVGAGLVLMRWVGDDSSAARAASIALHLVITFALLASLTFVAWYGSAGPRVGVAPAIPRALAAVLVASMVLLGMTGAVTALGDTLFPPASLAEGVAQDVSPGTHFLVRLRALHPLLALVVVGGGVAWVDRRRRVISHAPAKWRLTLLRGTLLMQLAAGAANVLLLAPVWLQLVHLLLADLVWMLLIVCLAEGRIVAEAPPAVLTA